MSHYDYSGWIERKKDVTTEKILKTLGHIFDEADKEGLDKDETCQVKDCWTILAMLESFDSYKCHHHHEHSHSEMSNGVMTQENGTANADMPEVVARASGLAVK